MRETVTIVVPGIDNPAEQHPAPKNQDVLRNIAKVIRAISGGQGVSQRKVPGVTTSRPTVRYSTAGACETLTLGAVATGQTATINGVVMTATQHRSAATCTCASAQAGDTVTVNGVVYTAVSGTPAANEFDISGNDTAAATSLAASINAALITDTGVFGKIQAKSALGVVTIFALITGTGGDAYTLVSSNGSRLAVTGSGFLAGGAAVGNNEFDYVASPAINATEFASQLAASTTSGLSNMVVGTNRGAVVTLVSAAVGDWVKIAGVKLLATASDTDDSHALAARTASAPANLWSQNSSDTNDAISLCNCINSHPALKDKFYAVNSSGVVSIWERSPAAATAPQISSSSGTTLAITVASNGAMQPTATVLVQALASGYAGNAITLAVSDATIVIGPPAGAATRLSRGAGVTATF